MPLLTIAGIPLSGKTSRANEIKKYLESQNTPFRNIILVNEEFLELDKKTAYESILYSL
jgi:tRNA uridine 5-carbamoylmethylation protein Kti12